MSEKEILEKNKMIAEFMKDTNTFLNGIDGFYCYHTSWDWLMPVAEKIEKMKFEDNDGTNMVYNFPYLRTFEGNIVRINRMGLHHSESRLLSLWYAVVEFIESTNNLKSQPVSNK